MFHYNGNPVSAQEAADIINQRRDEWHRNRLARERDRDARECTILRQLWTMVRGRS
ncbi:MULTISPECIES: hypothetical protein [Brevundimonas]|uniref:hypothetical protein n=1 Tax=unclassified Brevundimonas TaxID=2622653 RepID=UPI00142FBA47|nr:MULTISPECIES: hypothetical protein [Brevundimonas]